MTTIKVPLLQADADQLRRFIAESGLEIPPGNPDASALLALLKESGYRHDYIEVPDAEAQAARPLAQVTDRRMASTLDPTLFTRRDLGNCDAPLIYGRNLPHEEVKRLRSEGAIFLDGMTDKEVARVKAEQAEKKKLRDLRDNAFVRIKIPQSQNQEDLKMVPTSINGSAMWIPRGQPVYIRWPHFMALVGAVEGVMETDKDGRILGSRTVSSYPFQILDGPHMPIEFAA